MIQEAFWEGKEDYSILKVWDELVKGKLEEILKNFIKLKNYGKLQIDNN